MGSTAAIRQEIDAPMTVSVAEQQHHADMHRRSYELTVQRHHIERFDSAYRDFAR